MSNMAKTVDRMFLGLIIPGLFLCSSTIVNASTVVRTGDTVSIPEEQTIEGDFYSVAGKVNVSGKIDEDMIAAAGQITLNGEVGDNAFLVGGQTEIHGTVADDLRIISGETTIAEPVMGDLVVIGGSVTILSTASISGDVLLFAGDVTIEGSVGGDILGTVSDLRLDAPIAGSVDVTVDQLTLGDRANVTGSVRYVSEQSLMRAPDATISGDLSKSDPVLLGSKPSARAALVPIFILLFAMLAWYLVSRRTLDMVIGRALVKSPRPFLYGFATLILVPLAVAILFASMIGTLAALAVLFGYLFLVTLSLVGAAAVFGQLLLNTMNRSNRYVSLFSIIVGVVSIAVLMLLPIVGQIVLVVLLLVTLGSLVDIFLHPGRESGTL